MRLLKLILLYGFSFLYFDLASFKKRKVKLSPETLVENEFTVKREKKKRVERKYKNAKYHPQRKYRVKKLKYTGTQAKDKRYSNQRMLRRMYRNS